MVIMTVEDERHLQMPQACGAGRFCTRTLLRSAWFISDFQEPCYVSPEAYPARCTTQMEVWAPDKDECEVIQSVYEQTKLKSQSLEVNTGLNILDTEIRLLIQCKNLSIT